MHVVIQSTGGDVFKLIDIFGVEFPDGGTTDEILDLQDRLIPLGLYVGSWKPLEQGGSSIHLVVLPGVQWSAAPKKTENVMAAITSSCRAPVHV